MSNGNLQNSSRQITFKKTSSHLELNLILLPMILFTLIAAYLNTTLHQWLGACTTLTITAHLISRLKGVCKSSNMHYKLILLVTLLIVFLLLTMSGLIVSLIYSPKLVQFHKFITYGFITLTLFHLLLNQKYLLGSVKDMFRSMNNLGNGNKGG